MAILERTGRVTNPEDMLRVVEENKREWGLEYVTTILRATRIKIFGPVTNSNEAIPLSKKA